MTEETVVFWEAIRVSPEDADLLNRDVTLYGNCFVEVFETGPGKRVAPEKILSGEIQVRDGITLTKKPQ